MTRPTGSIPNGQSVPGSAQRLRFAIICRGFAFPAWQAAAIRDLLASGLAEPVLLLIADESVNNASAEARTWRSLFYRFYQRFWGVPRLKALRPVDLTEELGHLPAIWQQERTAGFGARAATELRGCRPDFILQFAFPHRADGLSSACRFGIWTYDAYPEDCHGMLTAFWGYRQGQPTLRRALLRIGGAQSGVLHQGWFRAGASRASCLDAALFGSADWCVRVCRQLLLELEGGSASLPLGALPGRKPLPGNGAVLRFLARRAGTVIMAVFRQYFLLEYWNIGIIDAEVERVVSGGAPASVRWLPSPRPLHYHADPFALPDQPESVLFEEYNHATGLGWISAISLTDRESSPRRIAAFDQGTHRSYPFLFSFEGATFCIPESASDRRVDLYRALRFPDLWQRAGTLIDDFPALDGTLFFHGDRWWLFCTSGDPGGEHKLYAWHAMDLLGPWEPHRLNPLKCDVSSSRPAGRPFLTGGALFRPAQDCSQTYGGAVVINRIVTLTPTDFSEIPSARIAPATASVYRDGLHTLCPFGRMTIIDGKRFRFDLRAPYLKAKRAGFFRGAQRNEGAVLSMSGGTGPR
jgi:hypothetical protein